LILKLLLGIFVFFLGLGCLTAQDFDDLAGVDAIFFPDIRSIEYRIIKINGEPDPTTQIGNLNEEIAKLKNEARDTDNPKTQDDLNQRIGIKQNQINQVYNDKTERDKWNLYYSQPLSPIPIVHLQSNQAIFFAFDDLNEEPTRYSYTIIPYQWDWSEPLDLTTSEYLEGYSYSEIDNFVFPELTNTNYTAHRFQFPNDDIKPLVSGNYLLVVYETGSEEIAFTRRVFVTGQAFSFVPDVRGNSFDRDSLQKINFTVRYPERYAHLAPGRDVKVVVLQNGRPDNAQVIEKPALAINRNLRYGYQDRIGFKPGKEFRFVMMQTFDYPQVGTHLVRQGDDDGYEVYLNAQEERSYHPTFFYRDLNGQFVTMNGVQNEEPGDPDYAHVYFTYLKDDPYYQADLYVVGKFSDWQFKDEYKLSFNPREGRYEGEAFLKQGYYDYYYALKHPDSDRIDIDRTEGHSFQTSNEYTVLVYYTTPNGRFDRLVASKSFVINH